MSSDCGDVSHDVSHARPADVEGLRRERGVQADRGPSGRLTTPRCHSEQEVTTWAACEASTEAVALREVGSVAKGKRCLVRLSNSKIGLCCLSG